MNALLFQDCLVHRHAELLCQSSYRWEFLTLEGWRTCYSSCFWCSISSLYWETCSSSSPLWFLPTSTPPCIFSCQCLMYFSLQWVPPKWYYLMGQSWTISYQGCASQLFFYHFLGSTKCFLYTVMAYDCFVAICHSLWYMVIKNPRVCTSLTVGSWLGSCLHGNILTFLVFKLLYCGPDELDNFFCDIPVVLALACADASLAQMVSFTNMDFVTLTCLILILTSYGCIVLSIFKIKSSEGRRRAFSTCSAHLISIILFYRPVMLVYLRPASIPWLDSVIQVLNNIVVPSLNPLIYTLRNKDVKLALRKALT